ncbi:hypothetical protein [Rickettsia peacockii]|uniref:hypothetical protein n=1 Tax=Rickettsia peacockii TaxID=47589 RepID=UPI0002F2BDD8|nr:hypothetical protein [Rickettsia peacockii]
MVDIVQIDGGDVTIQGTVKTGSISFTTAQSATLSLNNTSIINESITTTGNKIHTLAISNDLTTGASGSGSVGSQTQITLKPFSSTV